ncbi:hypothetical protein [Streptomyces fuscichromogenes]|uniref:Uncharacterized protein n=1 Tax=Streptomyces fuscichromogenes TaxID=1324013 RepID=A0A917XC92_9ACTN|nr:hypothetical protein [Streptomyces fuscichromogenes]GGN06989.1 hypothetical protein GCM10011578_031420 [Streptomyces fuscichromogenes]
MRLTRDTRDTLLMGAAAGGFPAVLLLVTELFVRMPWQWKVPLPAAAFVFGLLFAAMSMGDEERAADRRENSRVILLAWACLNGGRCATDRAAFTADGEGWELPASPHFRGSLLAVGHRDGVEVGISCSTHRDPETGSDQPMTVLVRLSEERSPARVHHRKIHRLGLGQHVESVAMDGRELWVRFEGWPSDFTELNAQVDAAVRLAARTQET